MKISAATSVGKVRAVNEDAYCVSPDTGGMRLAVVADGMGGHNAGDVASKKAIDIMSAIDLESEMSAKELLIDAINSANSTIHEMSLDSLEMSGMGTTITACIIDGNKVTVAQVGDSRLYLIENGLISQITKDHSLVQMLLESGSITETEALHHPKKNVITRAIGTDETVAADIYEFTANAADTLLICSDGLTNMLEDSEILSAITGADNPDCAVSELIRQAEDAGGVDNITVILIKL